MPTIPRSVIERYNRQLEMVTEANLKGLSDALEMVDWGADAATIREQLIVIMQVWCGMSSQQASMVAAVFYDGLRRELFGMMDGYEANAYVAQDPAATEGAVRAFVQDLVDGKPPESVIRKCCGRLSAETRRSANRCVERNARMDPSKPRWARVPAGNETCEFCIMLASRGFVYHNKELASHAHANCDCVVVPSWGKGSDKVEGYDPDYYLDCYLHPEKHPEIRDAINERRRELRAEHREESEEADG